MSSLGASSGLGCRRPVSPVQKKTNGFCQEKFRLPAKGLSLSGHFTGRQTRGICVRAAQGSNPDADGKAPSTPSPAAPDAPTERKPLPPFSPFSGTKISSLIADSPSRKSASKGPKEASSASSPFQSASSPPRTVADGPKSTSLGGKAPSAAATVTDAATSAEFSSNGAPSSAPSRVPSSLFGRGSQVPAGQTTAGQGPLQVPPRAARPPPKVNAVATGSSRPSLSFSGKKVIEAFKENASATGGPGRPARAAGLKGPSAPSNLFDDSRRSIETAGEKWSPEISKDQILLGLSFLATSALMMGTVYIVWKAGAIHFNEY